MGTPKLSIVIITLNEEERLPLLLEDLAAQSWADFEIIHVDSNSDDSTVALSQAAQTRFSHYQIIAMEKRGVSLGRNQGALHATAERLLFLDADTRLGPNFLKDAITELEKGDLDAGVVCMSAEGLALRYRMGFALFNAGIKFTSKFFPTAIGACMFSTAALHKSIDGFDESLSLCEDCNYALKAYRHDRRKVGVLKTKFRFDPRRLQQDGFASTGLTYLRANLRRFFIGELHNQEIPYEFGHYGKD